MKTANVVQETSFLVAVEHKYCLKWCVSPLIITEVTDAKPLESKTEFSRARGKKQ